MCAKYECQEFFTTFLNFAFFPRLFLIKAQKASLINLKQNHAEYERECESVVNGRTWLFFRDQFIQKWGILNVYIVCIYINKLELIRSVRCSIIVKNPFIAERIQTKYRNTWNFETIYYPRNFFHSTCMQPQKHHMVVYNHYGYVQ